LAFLNWNITEDLKPSKMYHTATLIGFGYRKEVSQYHAGGFRRKPVH
jgi:hypothetical protein